MVSAALADWTADGGGDSKTGSGGKPLPGSRAAWRPFESV